MLAVSGGTVNGSQIIMRTPSGGAEEEWAVTKDGVNGGYTLRSRYNGLAMDITKNEMANGTKVIQYPHKRSDNQAWKLVKAEHTIAYHTEGSTEFQKAQTKYYKEILVVTESIPVKEGFIFCGWSVGEADNEAEIMPGDTIMEDEDVDLYAVWEDDNRLVLPSGLTEIDEEAFCGSSAVNVIIPESCTKIGKRAFAECKQLKRIWIPKNAIQIADDAFEDSTDVMLYVFENSVAHQYALENGIRYGMIQQ